jgi:hypothetical protein
MDCARNVVRTKQQSVASASATIDTIESEECVRCVAGMLSSMAKPAYVRGITKAMDSPALPRLIYRQNWRLHFLGPLFLVEL